MHERANVAVLGDEDPAARGGFASARPKERSGLNRFPAFPCFRMIARPAAVKLDEGNHLFFRVLSKVQPLACGRDEANSQGKRMGSAGKELAQNRERTGG
jgi:hypothetical protein